MHIMNIRLDGIQDSRFGMRKMEHNWKTDIKVSKVNHLRSAVQPDEEKPFYFLATEQVEDRTAEDHCNIITIILA